MPEKKLVKEKGLESTSERPKSESVGSKTPHENYEFKRPKFVKGIYLTAWSAASTKKLSHLLEMADRTEINSMVIDVRDIGEMYWATGIPLADETVGNRFIAIRKPDRIFKALKAHGVWPIARIACFRDDYVPVKHPEQAVQLANGKVWRDRAKHAWLDPYDKRNWEYLGKVVDYALDAGFPEIQLDYVRFPSEGKSQTQVFSNRAKYTDPKASPQQVIGDFCGFIKQKVKARGAYLSADIFGIISSSKRDQGIGQDLETIAGPFDAVSPMVYPSHFAKGEYGIADPNRSPYEIINKSLTDYKTRLPNKVIRPWLQDFSLGGVTYGASEVKAQIKAAKDLGYDEYLIWNAANRYTESALGSKSGK